MAALLLAGCTSGSGAPPRGHGTTAPAGPPFASARPADDTILIGLQRQDPNTKLIGPRFTAEPHGIAMQPQQVDFVRFVNGVLEQMRQDGSLRQLAQTWLGDGTTFGPPPAAYRD